MRRTSGILFALLVSACMGSKQGSTSGGGNTLTAPDAGPPPPPPVADAGATDAGTTDAGAPDAGTGVSPLPLGGGDWPQYRHDPSGRWENPGTFSASEVANLRTRWTFEIGEYGDSEPIIADGRVFFTTAETAHVIAVDAMTGQLDWVQVLNLPLTDSCTTKVSHPGIWASVAVVGGTVYVPSPDGNLYALDEQTGNISWSVQIASPTPHAEYVEASPAVSPALGKLFLGVSSTFECDPVPGRILSVDLQSHAVQTQSLVNPGQTGATVWSSIGVDDASHLAFATTGDGAGSFLDEPLEQAILSFDPASLSVKDHWQDTLSTDNSDFGASPALFDAPDGTHLIAAPNKDGWLWVLRRDALGSGPVWKYQLAVSGDPIDPAGGKGSIVSPTFAGGRLYAAGGQTPQGEPGSVVAFDPATGAVLWKHVTPGYVLPGIPAVGDILVVASTIAGNQSSTLEILQASTGAVLATYSHGAATFGAPAVAHGLIVWVTYDGHVQALEVPDYR